MGAGLISGPYVIHAFQQILGSGLLEEFPKLRVGFLEAGADWTVRLVKGLRERNGAKVGEWLGERVFVSCGLDDELPFIISKLGEDFLITATDYPHAVPNRQDRLADGLRRRGDIEESTIEKILSDNPQRLYSF